jgi:hypothetical protein
MSNTSEGKSNANNNNDNHEVDSGSAYAGVDGMDDVSQHEDADEGSAGGLFDDAGFSESFNASVEEEKRAELRIVAGKREGDERVEAIRRGEPSIIKRAKAIAGIGAVDYPDKKYIQQGGMPVEIALPTDSNRWALFDAVFGAADEADRPHIDTFKGRFVDWKGRIVDDRYSMVELVRAMDAASLKGHSADQARKAFKEWGMQVKSNDLIKRFEVMVPEWDGVPRVDESLIKLFECFDTELNREFSRYFWLSLYCRITYPGCFAPMVLSLFGAQNSGKSFMAKLICQEILGAEEADSIQLDLSGDKVDFLRNITGSSIVASIGEMTGFNRGDLNKIKDFITRTGDPLHYKYEGHFTQERQWITVMDGNKYVGLQRDETGNRRFYPIFVAQMPDENGQPAWKEEYIVNFEGFREKLWHIMAECRAWINSNGGVKGYEKFVGTVIRKVAAFSRDEMANDRGTIQDDGLDTFLDAALDIVDIYEVNGSKNKGTFMKSMDVSNAVKDVSRKTCDVNYQHLKMKMLKRGGKYQYMGGKIRANGYFFSGILTQEDLRAKFAGPVDPEDDTIVTLKKAAKPGNDDF